MFLSQDLYLNNICKDPFSNKVTVTASQWIHFFQRGRVSFNSLYPRSCLFQSQSTARCLSHWSFPLHPNSRCPTQALTSLAGTGAVVFQPAPASCPHFHLLLSFSLLLQRGFSNSQITPCHSCCRHFKRTNPVSSVWCLRF